MNKSKSRKLRGNLKYSENFCDFLYDKLEDNGSGHSLGQALSTMPMSSIDGFFGTTDRRKIQREFSSWKKKLGEGKMVPTIRNLEILCKLMQTTPNAVLLPKKEGFDELGRGENAEVQYLSRDAICRFLNQLHMSNSWGKSGYRIPVFYFPQAFTFVFLCVNKNKSKSSAIFRIACWDSIGYQESKEISPNSIICFRHDSITAPLDLRTEGKKTSLNSYIGQNAKTKEKDPNDWENRLEDFLDDAYKGISNYADIVYKETLADQIKGLYRECFDIKENGTEKFKDEALFNLFDSGRNKSKEKKKVNEAIAIAGQKLEKSGSR